MNNLRLCLICFTSFCVIFGVGAFLTFTLSKAYKKDQEFFMKELVSAQASAIERRLERSMSSTYILAQEVRQNHGTFTNFEKFAEEVLQYHGGISNLQLAPNGIIEKIHPLKGNEQAIGHNILKDDARRKEAILALKERGLTLAGPFKLIQGGIAVIGRNPVFITNSNGTEYFWGFTSALIYLDDLLSVTELNSLEDKGYRYNLERIHPDTGKLEGFAKSAITLSSGTVSTPINVPNSQWFLHMSAPTSGITPWYSIGGYSVSALISLILVILLRRILLYPRHLKQVVKEQTQELYRLAHHDHLTELPNRLYLQQQLERLSEENDRYGSTTAILFIDLDDFKRINDLCGHAAGDQLLVEVSQRLNDSVRGSDMVARLGGDEFAILLLQIDSADEVGKIALKIIEKLSSPIIVSEKSFSVSASIGISMVPRDAEGPETAMRHADMAMYEAKKTGKNNFHFFDEALQAETLNKIRVQEELQDAVSEKQFILHYQPIIGTSSGDTKGYEALIRWDHPSEGLLYPDKFIEVAEHCDAIFDIGYWVIDEACKKIQEIPDDCWISVNVSARQFNDPSLVGKIQNSIKQHQISASDLVIEVTESSLMDDIDAAMEIMQQLQRMGIRVALDDFGTGYSSLALLKTLPIDLLKIDRSFVTDLASDAKGNHVLQGIVAIAHDLELSIIAEGVETQKQFNMLWGLKSDYCQGFLFSKPLPFEELDQQFSP